MKIAGVRCTWFILAVVAPLGWAQRAPDIAAGTTRENVVQLYGWPKGKSVSGDRENWLYPEFQVTLVNGRVVAVKYVSSETDALVTRDPLPGGLINVPGNAATTATTSPSPAAPVITPSAVPPSAARPPRPPQSVTTHPRRDVNPAASKPDPLPGNLALSPVTWIVLPSLGFVLWYVIAALSRRSKARELSEQLLRPAEPPALPRQSQRWEDHVADRLRRINRGVPPTSESTVASTGQATKETSLLPPVLVDELTPSLLSELEWKRFELLTALYFGATGVRAELTKTGADGGVDVYLYRTGEQRPFCYVQCKAWERRLVDVKVVRELYGVMAAAGVSSGVFATTGDFSDDARKFAAGCGIELITGDELIERFTRLPAEARTAILAQVTAGDYRTPSCPRCDIKLVWRAESFWGCPRYPRCRTVLRVRGPAAAA